jgi:xylulokinase
MEGNAFQLRRLRTEASSESHVQAVIVGGGAKSVLWCEIIASVLNRPLLRLRVSEATGLGAAMLAAVGVGQFTRPKDAAAAWVRPADLISPNPEWVDFYQSRIAQWSG